MSKKNYLDAARIKGGNNFNFNLDANLNDSIINNAPFILYQGAVNIGRGIEWVISAMPYLPEYHLVIAGVGDIYDDLIKNQNVNFNVNFNLNDSTINNSASKVIFLGRVEPVELRRLTPHAALGLSLLENRGLNYYYSLPNRIADFVQAGVPVLATDFPEIRAVVEDYGIGRLIPAQPFDRERNCSQPPDPQQLAEQIRDAIGWWQSLPIEERHARMTRAANELSWENDKKILLDAVNAIMH